MDIKDGYYKTQCMKLSTGREFSLARDNGALYKISDTITDSCVSE